MPRYFGYVGPEREKGGRGGGGKSMKVGVSVVREKGKREGGDWDTFLYLYSCRLGGKEKKKKR